MAKKLVKTYWEARWRLKSADQVEKFEDHKDNVDNEAACRLYAMQKARALKLEYDNRDAYTAVTIHECEVHEEELDRYTNDSVNKIMAPIRVSGAESND